MKKFAVVIIIALIAVILTVSCNRKVCPAYGKAETEQAELNV